MYTEIVVKKRAVSPFSALTLLKRIIWGLIENSIFRFSPRNFHNWRCFLPRLFGAKIGIGVHIYPGVTCWAPWNIEIGNHVGIADGVNLYSQDKIKIGEFSVISQNTYICCGSHDYRSVSFDLITRPISIGNNCWLAAGVFIHPGVILPPGVVIGARSVVVNNMPAWSVCAGNPCSFIKHYEKQNYESN